MGYHSAETENLRQVGTGSWSTSATLVLVQLELQPALWLSRALNKLFLLCRLLLQAPLLGFSSVSCPKALPNLATVRSLHFSEYVITFNYRSNRGKAGASAVTQEGRAGVSLFNGQDQQVLRRSVC